MLAVGLVVFSGSTHHPEAACVTMQASCPPQQAAEQDTAGEEGLSQEPRADAPEALPSLAVDDHAMPLSLPRRGHGRRSSQLQPPTEEEQAAEELGTAVDDGEEEKEELEELQGRRMLTRRQRAQAAEAAARRNARGLENTSANADPAAVVDGGPGRRGGRKSRISSIIVLEQPSQPAQAPAAERRVQQHTQAQVRGCLVDLRCNAAHPLPSATLLICTQQLAGPVVAGCAAGRRHCRRGAAGGGGTACDRGSGPRDARVRLFICERGDLQKHWLQITSSCGFL